jgi:beta-lactamase regulating signal transducer with metallopeptidase domain
MSQINLILQSELCTNLLSALLHSLWQGLIISGILLLYLRSRVAQDANSRYAASLIALFSIPVCLFFTWSILNYEPAPTSQDTIAAQSAEQLNTVAPQSQTYSLLINYNEIQKTTTSFNWKPPVIGLWLTGVLIMLLRAIYIIAGEATLQLQCKTLEDEKSKEIIEKLRKDMRITRKIQVAVSERISVPGVVGFFKPMLLLPVSMISGVPSEALQAILAHELAHIRRYDYLVNFCQMVIEAILFFNPAVWWISRQIRIEREVCCDNAGIASIGRRIRYAEVLIGWAQKMKEQDIEFAAASIGLGKQNDTGGMLERIKRIVSADHRPRLKVSWHIAAITLVLSIATLAALWQGTNMTVAFAGKLLTPQERIDKISEIEEEHFVIADREYTSEDNITISGTIKTIDNEPLSDNSSMRVKYERPHFSGTTEFRIQVSNNSDWSFKADGDFSIKSEYGIIWLQINSDGYAPAFAGPLQTEPGEQINNLELVLDKGFTAQLKVINESNEPISGVNLVGGYKHAPGMTSQEINLTTDANGLAFIENAPNKSITLKTNAEGYETEKFENIQLEPGLPAVLKLKRAIPTSGIVLSKAAGKPVPDAMIRLIRSDTNSYGARGAPILATTDEHGKFTLNTLHSDTRYILSVEAPDYAYKLLYDVMAGQEDLVAELRDKFQIKGRITGPLEKLDKKNGTYIIHYSTGVVYESFGSWDASKYTQVEIRDGQGYFEIEDFYGNGVRIGRDSYLKELDLEDEPVQEVVIDLTDKVTDIREEYKKRQVVIKFDYPKGYPAPEGIFKFKYIDPNYAPNTYKNHDIRIVNGQGTLDIPAPGKIAYENEGISGYWFKEKGEIKVPYAEEPFVVTVPAVPAGLIYGEIFNPDGTKTNNVLVSVVAVEKSPLMGDNSSLSVKGKDSAGPSEQDAKYIISPLPLKGKYVVIAHREFSYILSDPIELNDKTPIHQLDMTLREGEDFTIKVTDENGKPINNGTIMFSYETPWHYGFGSAIKSLNKDGEFHITNLNPNVPGYYNILINEVPGCRPIRKNIESFNKPLEIKLEKGYVVKGKVIDDKTGWPIPDVEVYALPEDFSIPEPTTYLDAEQKTDENGQFIFSNMAKRKYTLNTRTNHRYENGKLYYGSLSTAVIGGQKEEAVIRVVLSESSKLKPRKPE